jgi:tripartite-type tricarboxylate transporter receptor subunit TctC
MWTPIRLLACALAALPFVCAAQAYPSKPIRIVVPFPAGGGVDLLARVVGQRVSESLKQPVVIDNKPGATGLIGGEFVARAAPDGYTLLVATPGPMTIAAASGRKLNFDPLKDFRAITMGVWLTPVLVAGNDSPIKDVRSLIAAAKARPGAVSFGSGGIGNSQHLAGEMFAQMAGVKMNHVPFQGTAPALNGIMGGQIDVFFSDPSALALVQGGKLKAIAVSSPARSPRLPEVPTVAESGLTGFVYQNWYGFVAPAKTPDHVVNLLNREFRRALGAPDVQEKLMAAGMDVVPGTPDAFASFMEQDLKRWTKVIKSGNIKLE